MTSFDAIWNEAINEQVISFIATFGNVLEVSQTGECQRALEGFAES